jgi:hypothetical protein
LHKQRRYFTENQQKKLKLNLKQGLEGDKANALLPFKVFSVTNQPIQLDRQINAKFVVHQLKRTQDFVQGVIWNIF